MLNERKLTVRELDSREAVIQGLLGNKRNLVKKYGKDAEKVMYGIATKKAKTKVESMNKEKIKELIIKALTNEDATPKGEDFYYDYLDIGMFYLEGFGKKHSLDDNQLEKLGKKIVDRLYKGDVGKAYDAIVKRGKMKEDNDPSGEYLEGDPGEHVEEGTCGYDRDVKGKKLKGPGGLSENSSQDDAVMELRNIIDELEDKAEEARELVRQYFPNELSRLDGYGVFNVAYSGNRYDVTLGKFVDGLEDGNYDDLDDENYVNEEAIKEPIKLKDALERYSFGEILDTAAEHYEKDGEKDMALLARQTSAKFRKMLDDFDGGITEAELTKPETKKIKDMVKSLRKSSKGHAGQANYLSKLVKEKVDEDVSSANFAKGIDVIKATLSKEGGAAGLEPLVKELVKLGFKKDEVIDLLSKMTNVKKHRDGDYILLPLEEKKKNKSMKLPSGLVSYVDFVEGIYEKLSKKNDVGDFVDDFKKSKAKQFSGKSAKKKKEMAVAAYLAKQNDK